MSKGWKRESARHQMASRGIKTKILESRGLGGGDVYDGMPVKIDRKDMTAVFSAKKSWGGLRTFFITKRYNDGAYLAFWSDSPWGRTRNQDKGWVIIEVPKGKQIGEIKDFVQTYDFGSTSGDYEEDSYADFMKRNKKEHKGYKESYDEWRIGDE